MESSEITCARAEALFASCLQRSDDPTPEQVRAAVGASLLRLGNLGCAARVAQEFGDHPVEAVSRMSWVLAELRRTYPDTVTAAPSSAYPSAGSTPSSVGAPPVIAPAFAQ